MEYRVRERKVESLDYETVFVRVPGPFFSLAPLSTPSTPAVTAGILSRRFAAPLRGVVVRELKVRGLCAGQGQSACCVYESNQRERRCASVGKRQN